MTFKSVNPPQNKAWVLELDGLQLDVCTCVFQCYCVCKVEGKSVVL